MRRILISAAADGRCTRRASASTTHSRTDPEAAHRRRSQPRACTCSRCRGRDDDAMARCARIQVATLHSENTARLALPKMGVLVEPSVLRARQQIESVKR